MKKETLILIGAGIAVYYFYNKSKKAGTNATAQKQILSETFGKYLPQAQVNAKKKLKPVIEPMPLQSITKQEFEANKPKVLSKGLTLVKKLFQKKKVSGFDNCIGLY